MALAVLLHASVCSKFLSILQRKASDIFPAKNRREGLSLSHSNLPAHSYFRSPTQHDPTVNRAHILFNMLNYHIFFKNSLFPDRAGNFFLLQAGYPFFKSGVALDVSEKITKGESNG